MEGTAQSLCYSGLVIDMLGPVPCAGSGREWTSVTVDANNRLGGLPSLNPPRSSIDLLGCMKLMLLGRLVALMYGEVVPALVDDLWNERNLSYCFLIPPLALYIAWVRRDRTLAQPAVPDNWGLLGVGAACLFFLAGKLGAELFLSRLSLVLLFAGLVWTFWGLRRLGTLALPLVLMATMIPPSAILYSVPAALLQQLASTASASLIQLFGAPVYEEGNILYLSKISAGVVEAGSRLGFLSALLVLASLAGSVRCRRIRTRATLLVAGVLMAIGIHIVWLTCTALLGEL
jgi:exosortase